MVYAIPVKGVFVTNCYFLIDKTIKHGFLIDVGAQGKVFAEIIQRNGWTIEKILLTHAHFDHTGGIEELRKYSIFLFTLTEKVKSCLKILN